MGAEFQFAAGDCNPAGPGRCGAEADRAYGERHQDVVNCEFRRWSSMARSASVSSWIISVGDSRRTSA